MTNTAYTTYSIIIIIIIIVFISVLLIIWRNNVVPGLILDPYTQRLFHTLPNPASSIINSYAALSVPKLTPSLIFILSVLVL